MTINSDYLVEFLNLDLASGRPGAKTRWQEAFETAREAWQLDQAMRLLRMIKGHELTPRDQSVVRYLEGTLLVRLGDWAGAVAAFERALRLKREVGDQQGEMAVLNALANLLRRGDSPLPEVIKLLEHSLIVATEMGDEESEARIRNGLGLAYYSQGQLDQARAYFAQARSIARRLGQQALEATALHNLGSVAWTQGDLAEAASLFNASLDLQRALGDRHGEAETLNSLGLIQEAWGDWSAAAASYERGLAIMQTAGDLYGQVQVLANLGNVVWLMGDNDRALVYYQQALAMAEDLGDAKLEGQVLTGLGDTYRTLRRYADAERAFQRALERKKAVGDGRSLKHTYLSLGALYQVQKRIAEAQQAYEQALSHARTQQDTRIEAFALLNLALLALGQEVLELSRSYLDVAEGVAVTGDYRDCLALISQARGDLEMMQPAPDPEHILRHYAEACAYACDFNRLTLNKVLDHLVAVWTAHAEDGYVDEAIWFCESLITLWKEIEFADDFPEVVSILADLTGSLRDQQHPNGATDQWLVRHGQPN